MTKAIVSPGSEHAQSLTLWGWILLLSKASEITFVLLSKAARRLLDRPQNNQTFYQYITYEGTRDYQRDLSSVRIQNLLPSTLKQCEHFGRKHAVQHSKIHLSDGAVAVWFGSPKSSRVIVQFHGGGYMAPALSTHVSLPFAFRDQPHKDTSVVVLQYSLCSENANHYPLQLRQAVLLLEHLIYMEKISPSAITLIGDSAGAHLILGLLLHLSHPNPQVPTLNMEGQFAGTALISPWVSMERFPESMGYNGGKDILSSSALAYWAQNFLGGATLDPWNDLLITPEEWWADIPVTEILVLYGNDELIRDHTSSFCDRLKSKHPQVSTRKFDGEIHAHMVMNRFLRINKACESEKVFVEWLDNHLGV